MKQQPFLLSFVCLGNMAYSAYSRCRLIFTSFLKETLNFSLQTPTLVWLQEGDALSLDPDGSLGGPSAPQPLGGPSVYN